MRKCVLLCLLSFVASLTSAASLKEVSLNESSSSSKLAFTFTSKVRFKQFVLRYPWRIVFDFSGTSTTLALNKKSYHTRLVRKIRSASKKGGVLRVVVDANKFKDITLKKYQDKKGYHVVLNILSTAPKVTTPVVKKAVTKKPTVKVLKPKLRNIIVVIDPGHGGKDPGAIGRRGTREKRVVLAIAQKLKRMIDSTRGMAAKLTRRGDYYIPLRQRLALARKYDADVFISIHADAYKNRRSHGTSVYALSQRGATSEAARWLAAKENYSELGGVDLSELNDKSGLVRSVLIDLSQTATTKASLTLGRSVLNYLDDFTVLHHKGVEQAPFVVLKSPDIPSILIETGFISNRTEEKKLMGARYQYRIARSILSGLRRYFLAFPPKNSYLAHASKYYHVKKGDSLSKIAFSHQVSVKAIRRLNKLSSNTIKQGQRLLLPEPS